MHKKIPVAEIYIDDESCCISKISDIFDPEHIPVGINYSRGIINRSELNEWWLSRSIPSTRAGLRDALNLMGVSSKNSLPTKCFGLSVADQYWICPKNSDITWDKINFFDTGFSEDVGSALFGSAPKSDKIDLFSPDNTTDGWLQKKWYLSNGKTFLIKGGSAPYYQEPLNEVLASEILKRLNIAHVEYELVWENGLPYSVCENFITAETELIGAAYIAGAFKQPNHISAYDHFLNCCGELGIPNARNSLNEMLALDFIIANTDRHYGNFGAVRNAETLKWIGLSPIFDSGTSMRHDKNASTITPFGNCESRPFKKLHSEQIKLISENNFDFSALTGIEEWFDNLLAGSPFIDENRRKILCQTLKHRIEAAQNILR